jgi:four helix bundle protein
MFGFQKLDVYRCAVTFLGVASTLAERVPRGHSALADQLRRAALSVPLNIAEGIIESHKKEALPHYKGGRGYQPSLVYWVEQDVVVADEFRDGN